MPTLTLIPEHKELLERHPEFTRKWAEGLRSGKYTQYIGGMCDEDIPQSACCLHVMEMECNGSRWEDGIERVTPSQFSDFRIERTLPEDLIATLSDGMGRYTPDLWNDYLEISFNQIADLLENGEVTYEE